MVFDRPLLYISLPGVAFILGVFWFRRRNKNQFDRDMKGSCDGLKEHLSTNNRQEIKDESMTITTANGNLKTNGTATKSININGTLPHEDKKGIFGKSAPIQIVQNGRGTSPLKQSQSQLDSEVLKSKIQDAEHKLLRSIDEDLENLSSPDNLPDSYNANMSYYSRTVDIKKENPVVIVATTTPKISPENSFLESKYIKASESPVDKSPAKTTVSDIINNKEIAENDTVIDKDIEIVNDTITEDSNVNKKRNEDTASPSLSLCSIQSGDSGKGSSLPRSEAARAKTTYEFFLPNSLVGHLYGRRRSFINLIKTKTNASVILREQLYTDKLRICAIEGTENDIEAAIAMIRQRLPIKRYPNLTLQRIHYALPQSVVPLSTESLLSLKLNLIEGINNDVVVSAIISGGHFFVQQPLHPTHPSLAILQKCLYDYYSTTEAPLLPGIELNAVCVMPVNGVWYRVEIIDQDAEETDRCLVKFLDFGGYMNVKFKELRQIRADFMNVPFQATECVLSNVEPIDTCWSADSADILSQLTKGIVLQAQVAGYNSQNIPEIYLFATLGPNNVIFLNKELAARNLANWIDVID